MATLEQRDWAHLPPELLESIAASITQIPDLIRFSCVCFQWRSAAKSVSTLLPPQSPWLLLPAGDRTATGRLFFSLAANRTYSIPLPETRRTRTNKIHPSPTGGWILAPQDVETLALTNPLTRSSTPLPPLPLTESRRKNIGAYVLRKAKVLGSNLVAVLFPHGEDILLCGLGDSSWRRIQVPSDCVGVDFVCCNGRFYFGHLGTLSVYDVHTLENTEKIPLVRGSRVCDYLVESPQGELLLVRRKPEDVGRRFQVFLLDSSGVKLVWIELNSIGDNVLFVDGVQAMAFRARDLEGCRENCIYFVDYIREPKDKGVMVFDIEKGQVGRDPLFSFSSRGYWGKAMWVVPSLGNDFAEMKKSSS